MAVKTMTVSSGGDDKFAEGWHELTIATAKYGESAGKKIITLTFEGYPDNMDLRIYEAYTKKDNQEFKISNLFKHANAGIMGVLKDPSGKHPVIQYDDEAENLVSKKVNVLFYKEKKTGKGYTRMHDMLAPVMQEGEHLSYNAEEVETIKASVKKSLDAFISKQTTVNSEAPVEGEAPFATNTF